MEALGGLLPTSSFPLGPVALLYYQNTVRKMFVAEKLSLRLLFLSARKNV